VSLFEHQLKALCVF